MSEARDPPAEGRVGRVTVNAIEWYDFVLFGPLPRSSLDRWRRFWSACGRIRTDVLSPSGQGDPDVDGNGVDRVRADLGDRGCAVAHRSVRRSNRDYPPRVRPALSR